MELKDLRDLFLEELADLYSAETQLVEALPKMAEAATSPDLKKSFLTHLKQTEGQVDRLNQIFEQLGETPDKKVCKGMKGAIAEGAEMIKQEAVPAVKDAGLISAAQRVEHYEMAGYGCARTYAQELGETAAAELLQETLNEETETNDKLTTLAEKVINLKAKGKQLAHA
jgi:ferritin-like metal-binding protein YciE